MSYIMIQKQHSMRHKEMKRERKQYNNMIVLKHNSERQNTTQNNIT